MAATKVKQCVYSLPNLLWTMNAWVIYYVRVALKTEIAVSKSVLLSTARPIHNNGSCRPGPLGWSLSCTRPWRIPHRIHQNGPPSYYRKRQDSTTKGYSYTNRTVDEAKAAKRSNYTTPPCRPEKVGRHGKNGLSLVAEESSPDGVEAVLVD